MKNKKIEEVINTSITASFKDRNMQISVEGDEGYWNIRSSEKICRI